MTNREDLLKELSTMIDLDTMRKHRSDAGVKRGQRTSLTQEQTKMAIYNRLKSRITSRARKEALEGNTLLLYEFDENGFYIVIPETYTTKAVDYKQNYQGREIDHTVRRIRTQKMIDLEKYRFEAWQELACDPSTRDTVIEPSPDIRGILLHRYGLNPKVASEKIKKRQLTWSQWFEEVYFINQYEAPLWTYNKWREHYDCCPPQLLPEDFRFSLAHKPGTPEHHPEWAWYKEKKDRAALNLEEEEKKRRKEQFIANMHNKRRI